MEVRRTILWLAAIVCVVGALLYKLGIPGVENVVYAAAVVGTWVFFSIRQYPKN